MSFRLFLILQLFAVFQLAKASGNATLPPTTLPPTTRPPPMMIPQACIKANERCGFEFQGSRGKLARFWIGKGIDKPFTTRVVSKKAGETLGVLNSNGIPAEIILPSGRFEPINWFGKPRFTPNHIKPFRLGRGSGIGHQTLTGNQFQTLQRACVRVFFTSYQVIIGPKPKDVRNVNAKRRDFKCVVFLID